jgi:UDP-2,3-diacylglucosamine pyrophosphatase LpxH
VRTAVDSQQKGAHMTGRTAHRTIFISDVHLGTRGCKAEDLAEFLRAHECETLYLVGDIVDGWQLKRAWYWNSAHNDVIREIQRMARAGTQVIYVPGNHDEVLRGFVDNDYGGIHLKYEDVHETADGRRLLIIHGDHFDGFVRYGRLACMIGGWAYRCTLLINDLLNWLRRRVGRDYWSLSGFLKTRIRNAARFIRKYEKAVAGEAARRGLDGVVCGHIHQAALHEIEGVVYCNCGDWVESRTALVENHDGIFTIVRWTRDRKAVHASPRLKAAA